MTETVIITGEQLTIDHTKPDAKPDPKRRRPPAYNPPEATANIQETIAQGNPFWSAEANQAAESNVEGLSPLKLARKWKHYRIEQT